MIRDEVKLFLTSYAKKTIKISLEFIQVFDISKIDVNELIIGLFVRYKISDE